MITPEEFPYIKSLYVNDCYAYKDFNIELRDYKPFSHLILTGKNGSGKSTILEGINSYLFSLFNPWLNIDSADRVLKLDFESEIQLFFSEHQREIIYINIQAKRDSKVNAVDTVIKDNDLSTKILTDRYKSSSWFKQFLVNKKVAQAFDQINNNQSGVIEINQLFARLTKSFRQIFEDDGLNLEFRQEDFEFFINMSDGRRLTFDVLSEGFSALISILMDLFMRVDLIRKQVNNYTYNPSGIVLIDEPETHLHLQLQEQVLPLLTSLFPNIQFIAATHSPAVIASIKNATIFDLTTKESRGSEETVGRSYSDLMMSHFGLNNEYSETADQIINQVNDVLNKLSDKPTEMKQKLQKIYDDNSAYLSPTLKIELELLIAQQEAQQITHQ